MSYELPRISVRNAGLNLSMRHEIIFEKGNGSGDEFSTSNPLPIQPQSLYALVLLDEGRWVRYVRPFVQISSC